MLEHTVYTRDDAFYTMSKDGVLRNWRVMPDATIRETNHQGALIVKTGTQVLLVSNPVEIPLYEAAYPDLLADVMVFRADQPHRIEGLRVTRVFVTETIPRDNEAVQMLHSSLVMMPNADNWPIFLTLEGRA